MRARYLRSDDSECTPSPGSASEAAAAAAAAGGAGGAGAAGVEDAEWWEGGAKASNGDAGDGRIESKYASACSGEGASSSETEIALKDTREGAP